MELLEQSLLQLLNHFVDSNKRLFWLYIISSIALALLLGFKGESLSAKLRHIFSLKVWRHPSARLDYGVFVINLAIKFLLITPLLFSVASVAININFGLERLFGEFYYQPTIKEWSLPAFTLLLFLLDDFSRFFLHWLSHKWSILWRFHQVHHSAEVLTPVTVYRIHPVESALYAARLLLSQSVAIGVGFYLFGTQLSFQEVLGANMFVFLFNFFGANLRHSHIWIGWGKLEHLVISPAQHQIHHSIHQSHYDKNFGSALSLWDKLFGTWLSSQNTTKPRRFGLKGKRFNSLKSLYLPRLK